MNEAIRAGLILAMLATMSMTLSCKSSGSGSAAECDPDPGTGGKVQIERISLGRVGGGEKTDENADWCRACVWSDVGFASCQRVYATREKEAQEEIRARARATACKDAGWPADACPDEKVLSIMCKGDAPPAGTKEPGAALQDLYRELNLDKFEKQASAGSEPGADAGAGPAASAPE